MKVQRRKTAELSEDPANARAHPEQNIAALVASLRRFGQQKPIVIDSRGTVRAGNGTLQAARVLEWEKIDVVVSDLADQELTAYAIADNRTAELAEWDAEALARQLAAMNPTEDDALSMGFDADEIAKRLGLVDAEADDEALEVPADFQYLVVVEDLNEQQQATLIERLESEGFTCRALIS